MEEVSLIIKGGNYGWRKYEGTKLNFANDPDIPLHIPPILEYSHEFAGGNPSSIGGYIYRGTADACFYGKYIYADHTAGYFAASETFPSSGMFSQSV